MSKAQSNKSTGGDCRCVCGSLVARLVAQGVELKCRRCKRTVVVPLAGPVPSRPALEAVPVRQTG